MEVILLKRNEIVVAKQDITHDNQSLSNFFLCQLSYIIAKSNNCLLHKKKLLIMLHASKRLRILSSD